MYSIDILSIITIILYLAAAILLWRPLMQADDYDGASRTPAFASAMVFAGLVTHSMILRQQLFVGGGLNLAIVNVASLISLVAVLTLLLVSLVRPFQNLGIAILPLTALAVLVTWLAPGDAVISRPATAAQTVHIVVSLFAYSLLFLAALQSLLLLVQERHLRQHQPGGFMRALPPMETMEGLMFTMIGSGFTLLTLTLISGVFFSETLFNQPLRFTHHIVLSVAAWFVFGVLLIGHWKLGWRGRKAVLWTLTGFMLLLLAYFGSKFVFEIIKQG